jgi:hypothetical protein
MMVLLLPVQMPVLPVCWFRQPFVPSFSLSLESDYRAILIEESLPAFMSNFKINH